MVGERYFQQPRLSNGGQREHQYTHHHHNVTVQQKLLIPNYHGEKLVGVLHETGSKELVVLCHGFRSSKVQEDLVWLLQLTECGHLQDHIPVVKLAAALGKFGISTFCFDFAGNGESAGLFQYGNYRKEAEDLRAVVQHFRGKEHAISAIIGHSKGGNVVLLYASKYHDVHTIINISGRFDLAKGIEDRLGKDFLKIIKQEGFIDVKNRRGKFEYRVTEESLMDRLTTDIQEACRLIPEDCRVLTVHGSMDQIVPVNDAAEFAKVIPNHTLRIIYGADHEYSSHQDELASVVADFLRTGLRQGGEAMEQLPSHAGASSSVHSRL
ncbi:hypothetical protein Ancab_002006 [Ancistrocladus abbreviatus]